VYFSNLRFAHQTKTIKAGSAEYLGMSEGVTTGLRDLIVNFVQTYSEVRDIELDDQLNPKPWFMPLNTPDAKKEAAHYFLLAASLSDYKLTGNPRNIRLLLSRLHKSLEGKLYTITKPSDFTLELSRFEQEIKKFDHLGEDKSEIPEVLCSVNLFVYNKAGGDLIKYTTELAGKGRKPKDLVQQLSYSVKRMNKQHKSKAWLYLRWMTRLAPDLALFPFNPKDLMVPLTTPTLRVYAALGLSNNENLPFELSAKNHPDSWWNSTAEFDADAERLTAFARSLFPEDPAKVDVPFFILGTWLEYSDLTPASLERSLGFFIKKHNELLQPLMRYLTIVYHYNRAGEVIEPGTTSAMEWDVYNFLRQRQIIFSYEFMEFYLTQENLTYKPDFLLPKLTDKGRKVILEPHGVRAKLFQELAKLSIFRKHFGQYFCLILIVPDEYVEVIDRLDAKHLSYDYLWKQSSYKIQLENFRST
jgi:hypothetical protein